MTSMIAQDFLAATCRGNLRVVQRLCVQHADELAEHMAHALRLAGDAGCTEICAYLINRDVPVDSLNQGHTALMSAAMMGRSQTCLKLLESGADSLQIRSDGLGVVAIARASGREETTALLMAWQAKDAARLAIAELTSQASLGHP